MNQLAIYDQCAQIVRSFHGEISDKARDGLVNCILHFKGLAEPAAAKHHMDAGLLEHAAGLLADYPCVADGLRELDATLRADPECSYCHGKHTRAECKSAPARPCPFCGHDPQIVGHSRDGWNDGVQFSIYCDNEDCIEVGTSGATRAEVLKAWNIRCDEVTA